MRGTLIPALLSYPAWLGVIQVVAPPPSADVTSRAVAMASVLGTLTVLVYRLGVWRQEMENTRHNVGAEVKAHRDESSANFVRLDRRLEAIDQMLAASAERSLRVARWQARMTRRCERLEATQLPSVETQR
jgi:hypothetical protein